MFKRLLMGGCVVLLLSACASAPTRTALSADAKKELSRTEAHIFVPQDEVIVRAQAGGVSAAMGGGLIGALIDSNIAKGRQNTIQGALEPFYASVDDVDVRKHLVNALSAGLGSDFAINVDTVRGSAVALVGSALDAKKAALQPGKGFMQIGTTYTFSPDFSRLNMSTHVDLWQGGKSVPVYSNNFFYQSAAVSNSGADALGLWSKDNGERYRKAVSQAADQIAKMIRMDISAPSTESAPAKSLTVASMDAPGTFKITGPVLDTQADRTIMRNADGFLYSVPQ
ncbi:hypothetical protein [Rhodoferax saidenbachensis]|uniref:Lipoprotein n=1 Tax=Rhodoferax saidenbachensis TaxID=1484693 RepID=A0ABU1ZLL7_9BURK|nr:hypothetical protein [Rhodoferax saidenbachensis]MDR7306288.1 hypothetical protein [Rhodoferax saidenbachensis]